MARSGILGQSKPAGTTNTVLYAAPTNKSASAVLTIANDGTGAAYDVALKDYDQNLTMDASTYLFHEGDVITSQRFTLSPNITPDESITPGDQLTSASGEKKAKFHGFYIPATTTIHVRKVSLTAITVENPNGDFNIGATLSKGTAPNATTALIYDAYNAGSNLIIQVGPSTVNGSGSAFAAGDSVSASSGGSATIATGGIGTAGDEFVFSTDNETTFGFYAQTSDYDLNVFTDRTYRFDVSDSSMSGRLLRLSSTINGEYGPDNDAATAGDNGTEYTDGKTTNGTAGSSGAYVQYDFTQGTPPSVLYWYDGNTGSNAGAGYGGSERYLGTTTQYEYSEIYVYDIENTWSNSTDTFAVGNSSFTVTAQTAGKWGVVRDYTSTALKIIKGLNSADFAGSEVFLDSPLKAGATRSFATVSSIGTATTALEAQHYIVKDKTNAANNIDKITSIVVGPGQRVIVESATQNNIFSLVGFEDNSTELSVRNYTSS